MLFGEQIFGVPALVSLGVVVAAVKTFTIGLALVISTAGAVVVMCVIGFGMGISAGAPSKQRKRDSG
jgi:hypothetical protein